MANQQSALLQETKAKIVEILGPQVEQLAVKRVVLGLFFIGVELGDGCCGASASPIKTIPEAVCCPNSVKAMPFPGKLQGRRALDLMDEAFADNGLRRAVGIATMNALTEICWRRRPHPGVDLLSDIDAFDAADIRAGENVAVVGAFVPFLRKLKQRRQPFIVIEQDPATLKPDEMPFFRPADQADCVVPQADVVIITGTTLINGTLEALLSLARPEARVVIVGPTIGMLPDAFLRRGVDILGGIRVTKPDAFLDILAEGGSGYHFFGRSAERVVLLRRSPGINAKATLPRFMTDASFDVVGP